MQDMTEQACRSILLIADSSPKGKLDVLAQDHHTAENTMRSPVCALQGLERHRLRR